MDLVSDWESVRNAVLWLAPAFGLPVYCFFISQTKRNWLQHALWVIGITMCCLIPLTVPATNTAVRFLALLPFLALSQFCVLWLVCYYYSMMPHCIN